MSRMLIGAALGLLIGAAPPTTPPEERPKDKPPGYRTEKIDPSVDRSMTGVIEKVEAKDENSGKLTLRSSAVPDAKLFRYTFEIDEGKTKLLTAEGEPLKDGLKSQVLNGAEVRVTFVDRRPGSTDTPPPNTFFARTVQIIMPGK